MTDHFFDHDPLDVYRLSIEYVAKAIDTLIHRGRWRDFIAMHAISGYEQPNPFRSTLPRASENEA